MPLHTLPEEYLPGLVIGHTFVEGALFPAFSAGENDAFIVITASLYRRADTCRW